MICGGETRDFGRNLANLLSVGGFELCVGKRVEELHEGLVVLGKCGDGVGISWPSDRSCQVDGCDLVARVLQAVSELEPTPGSMASPVD